MTISEFKRLLVEIESYKHDCLASLHAEKKYYEDCSFEDAIKNAAKGRNHNGKMHSHQYRIGRIRGEKASLEIGEYKEEVDACVSFEQIFSITEQIKNKVYGLGNLWSYDTALRIGFNKGIYPNEVYIQAGVVKGVKLIFGFKPKGRSLSIHIFPEQIRSKLKPYEMENFLCIYGRGRSKIVAC